MKPPVTMFTMVYTHWLDSVRAVLPGGAPAGPARELPPKKPAQVAAEQEWEHEGGCITPPETKPGLAPAPKIPF